MFLCVVAIRLDGSIAMQSRVRLFSPDMFGCFALRANLLGHLEQIESYAPGHQVRFGSLNYTADIRGDLIFDGFEPLPCAPRGHDEYDLALPSVRIQEIAPAAAPTLNSEPVASSMDGWMDPTTEALPSAAIEPNIDLTLHGLRTAYARS